jgi:hypothetical protein
VYLDHIGVYDCEKSTSADAEVSAFNASGEMLYHYKWADPQYLSLGFAVPIVAGSVLASGKTIACEMRNRLPLVSKDQLAKWDFSYFASTSSGDGDMYYTLPLVRDKDENEKHVISIMKLRADQSVLALLPSDVKIPDPPKFRVEVDFIALKCRESQAAFIDIENWDSSNRLVRIAFNAVPEFKPVIDNSPFGTLRRMLCSTNTTTSDRQVSGGQH